MTTFTESEASNAYCVLIKRKGCLGKECMAWRWSGYEPVRKKIRATSFQETDEMARYMHKGDQPPPNWEYVKYDDEGVALWLEPQEIANTRRRGYCGLAGKPEFTS